MKQEVSPVVIVISIVVFIGIAALGWFQFTGVSHQQTPPPGMPPDVAKQWAQYTNGAAAGRGATGSIPGKQPGASPSGPGSRPPVPPANAPIANGQ